MSKKHNRLDDRVEPIAVPILDKFKAQLLNPIDNQTEAENSNTSDRYQQDLDSLIEYVKGDRIITPQEKQELRKAAEKAGYSYDEFEQLITELQKQLGQSFLLG